MFQSLSLLQTWISTRRSDERGATMVEYGLMVGFIALVCILAVSSIGGTLNGFFTKVAGSV